VVACACSANMNVDENELATNVIVHSDGTVSLFRSIITDVTCNLDLTYFPFDQVSSPLEKEKFSTSPPRGRWFSAAHL